MKFMGLISMKRLYKMAKNEGTIIEGFTDGKKLLHNLT